MGTGPVDVVVVGSGPNGLAAAVTLARAGLSVRVFEAAGSAGGGARSAELTLPGHWHDVCSAVHPMALASPFFRAFDLASKVPFVTPDISYAQVFDGGRSGIAYRDLERTAAELGSAEGKAWRRLFAPLLQDQDAVVDFAMSPLLRGARHPLTAAVFGSRVLATARAVDGGLGTIGGGMLAGLAAHAIGPVSSFGARGTALLLGTLAHAPGGWPIPIGGSQAIVDALVADLEAHGGEIVTETRIDSLRELPSSHAVLLDVTPRALERIGGDLLPAGYRAALRGFRYGDAASKVDFVLDGPVPWADGRLASAGTLHLAGSAAEVQAGEREVARGRHPEHPYVLVSQPDVADPGRAPAGHQTLWAYTHVPRGSGRDMTEAITARIEQFAPGFRDRIVASAAIPASALQLYNANYVDGDIPGVRRPSGSWCRGRCCRRRPGARRWRGCICARRPRRRGRECTGWRGGTRRVRLWRTCSGLLKTRCVSCRGRRASLGAPGARRSLPGEPRHVSVRSRDAAFGRIPRPHAHLGSASRA